MDPPNADTKKKKISHPKHLERVHPPASFAAGCSTRNLRGGGAVTPSICAAGARGETRRTWPWLRRAVSPAWGIYGLAPIPGQCPPRTRLVQKPRIRPSVYRPGTCPWPGLVALAAPVVIPRWPCDLPRPDRSRACHQHSMFGTGWGVQAPRISVGLSSALARNWVTRLAGAGAAGLPCLRRRVLWPFGRLTRPPPDRWARQRALGLAPRRPLVLRPPS